MNRNLKKLKKEELFMEIEIVNYSIDKNNKVIKEEHYVLDNKYQYVRDVKQNEDNNFVEKIK